MIEPRPPGPPIAVAIVDDDAAVRISLRRLCEALGWHASAYASGREFFEALDLDSTCPDCLLLDAQMPEMTGLEVQGRVRSRGLRVATLIITADDLEDRAQYLAAGAAEILLKPIGADELRAAIDRAGVG